MMSHYPPVKRKHGQRIVARPVETTWDTGGIINVQSDNTLVSQSALTQSFCEYWQGSDAQVKTILEGTVKTIELRGENTMHISLRGTVVLCIDACAESKNTLHITSETSSRQVIRVLGRRSSTTTVCFSGSCDTYVSYRQARLEHNAGISWTDNTCATRGSIIHHDELKAPHAHSVQDVRHRSSEASHMDISLTAVHCARHTTSSLTGRATSARDAQVILRGSVHMHEESTGSKSRQELKTLNLGGESDAIPQLHIANNDVVCSHKASVETITDDRLFYLVQRGIDPKTARTMIIEGFLQ